MVGYSALGVGGASAAAMAVFIALRASALDRLNAACPGLTRCPRSVQSIVSEGKTAATLVNVFGVAAGAAVVGGVVLVSTAPSHAATKGKPAKTPPASLTLTPTLGRNQAGISLEGAF